MSTRREISQTPVLVRRPLCAQPGLHGYSVSGRSAQKPSRGRKLLTLRTLLFLLGLCGVGFYGYTLADVHVYQAYQNWAFDQQIAGHRVNFEDYLRAETPLGLVMGPAVDRGPVATPVPTENRPQYRIAPAHDALLGRIAIDRLDLSAIVREGADAETLSRAVGHVPSTALAGDNGNFAIAAHRDTLFRALKDIRLGDLVTFESPTRMYTYQVFSTRIVKPSNISVLRSDGGLKYAAYSPGRPLQQPKLLTMITCYPFYFVGSAPQRFIVQARLVRSAPVLSPNIQSVRNNNSPAGAPRKKNGHVPRKRLVQQASQPRPVFASF